MTTVVRVGTVSRLARSRRTQVPAAVRSPVRAVASVAAAVCGVGGLSAAVLRASTSSFVPRVGGHLGRALLLGQIRSLSSVRSTDTATVEAPAAEADVENPLLASAAAFDVPRFGSIEASHVEPGMKNLIGSLQTGFAEFELQLAEKEASYEGVVEELEKLRFPLGYSWGVVSHLNGVKNSDALRDAYQAAQPEVVKASMAMEQSRAVYDQLAALEGKKGDLSETRQRIVAASLRSMRHSGVDLEGKTKEEFNEIALKLSELSTKFSNNVLDATKAFELVLTEKADVEGLPASALGAAAQMYEMEYGGEKAKEGAEKATPEEGPWRLTLDMPSYLAAMKFAKSSELREKLYRAQVTRASSGEVDNQPIIAEILKLKQQSTQLLGFNNYAEQSLASKMADDPEAVQKLTDDLFAKARPAAEKELEELKEFAAKKGSEGEMQLWDMTYWAERLKEEKYAYDEEALKPYFALPKVLDGMFGIASKLFGIEIERADDAAERWHADVMFFRVLDSDSGKQIASFFLDPYARPGEKRGGAWMADCMGRSKALSTKPVAYLTCNGSPPVADAPSLMTFSDAETLFHEFGHGLQHMLTDVEDGDAAGINNVEWDAVELPSQFMENWLYHKATVDSFAVHYETGEPLPADVFEKIKGARTFMAASGMIRQLQFGALDMELHKIQDLAASGETAFDVQKRISDKYAVMKPLDEDRFLCSFNHIFAGGYAAGYYSYKWAEVLSADAFAAFEDAGLDNPDALAETGRRFRKTVLGYGGSKHPSEVFREFRGKDASVDALLRHNGFIDA